MSLIRIYYIIFKNEQSDWLEIMLIARQQHGKGRHAVRHLKQ